MGKCKRIQMFREDELIKEYKSITEASVDLGCVPSTISKICGKRNKAYKGYKFRYKDIDAN